MLTLTCRSTLIYQDGQAEASSSRSPPFTFMSLLHSHITVTDTRLHTRLIMEGMSLTRGRIGETQEWIHTEEVHAKIHTIEILTEEVRERIHTKGILTEEVRPRAKTGKLNEATSTRCVGNPQTIRTARVLTKISQPNQETQMCNSLYPRPLLQVTHNGFGVNSQEKIQHQQTHKVHKKNPVPSSLSLSNPRVQRYQ